MAYGLIEKIVDEKIARLKGLLGELPTSLSAFFAPILHTHTSGQITDFTEAAQDAVGLIATEGIQYLDGSPAALKAHISGLSDDVSPDGTADYVMTYDASAGVHKKVLLSNLPTTGSSPMSGLNYTVCNGRLTLESGAPISTTDQIGKTTIYFTPYLGAQIGLYSGSAWAVYTFTERSLALGTLTSGKNYDVFLYDNAGTLTLEFSAAWTSDTARNDALVLQDGVLVKSGATTRRYLGTFRTTATTTTEDSFGGTTINVGGKRFVWNAYNPVRRYLAVIDTTSSWSYPTAAVRSARAQAGNCVEYVTGDLSLTVEALLVCGVNLQSNSARAAHIGIGVDSTSAYSGVRGVGFSGLTTAANQQTLSCYYHGMPGLGYHKLNWLESGSDGTCLFLSGSTSTSEAAGMTATLWC